MPLLTDSLTIPPASSLNNTGKGAAARQLPAAADRAVVPLVYGEDRISGLLLNALTAAGTPGTLLVQVLWCFACDSINDLRLNDAELPAGCTVTHYTGSQTVADTTLVAAFAAQSITGVRPLTGYAWSLIAMPAALFDGQINFTARIRGRRCYDPTFDSTASGVGPQRVNDPSTWAYSDIPAVHLGDFLSNTVYGCGLAVNWDSVRITGAANRVIVPGSSEQRRLSGVSFTSAAPASDVAETLRAYASCFLLPSASGVRLLPDADDAPVATYRHAYGEIANIQALELRDQGQAPTAVEVIYTDTSAIPWRDASATAQLDGAGTTKPWRLSQVRLPGIHRYGQAKREAAERLNKLWLNDITTQLEVFDVGIKHDKGDIITVDHPVGLSNTAMRVVDVSMPGPGRWLLDLARHSSAAYSDIVASAAAIADASRSVPAPQIPPAGENLIPNPTSELGIVAGTGGNGVLYAPGIAFAGGYVRHMPSPGGSMALLVLSDEIACADGDQFVVEAQVITSPSNGNGILYASFKNGSGTEIATPGVAVVANDFYYVKAAVRVTAPSGARSVVFAFRSSAAADYYLDDLRAYRVAPALISAEAAAAGAQGDATAALSTLATMRSNGYIDAAEKPALIKQWQTIVDESGGIYDKGTAYGLATLRDVYSAAYINLSDYLGSLSPSWNNTSADTPITPAVDQAKWAAYYSARQALLNAIYDETAKRALWPQISGTGKPADNATVNNVTYSMSAPGSAVDGDIWVDLSTTPARIKLRVGGSWQSGATLTTNTNQLTDGANLGSTAVWAQVSGTGRPADNATKNALTRSTSAPSSPTDGDLWCDTSLTPNVWKVRLGGTWQPAASYVTNTADIVDGANLGLTAVWTGVTGSGKPADNATRNYTYRQSGDPVSSPGGVVNGELWLDTGTGKAWQRVSGAWQPYVGDGSVNTDQLAEQAATVVAVFTDTGVTYSNIG